MANLSRFIYDNLITAESMFSVSSVESGLVTAALKEGTGSAVMSPSGSYSGTVDLEYVVEIDSIAGGAEVGQATFRWSDDGGSTWDASGVTTSTANTLLNNGVNVKWTSGSGADFVVGDKWYLKGINSFSAGKMIDYDRDTRYRSDTLDAPNTIAVDFGSAQEVKVLVVFDHNFTNAATLTLEADDAATFDSDGGSPQFSEAVTWNDEKIVHYLSVATTKRHFRLQVADAGNTDGYIEVGEFFLGAYLQLSRTYKEGFAENTNLLTDTQRTPYGVGKDRFYNEQLTFSFVFRAMTPTDVTNMKTMISTISDRGTGIINPVFFNVNTTTPNDTYLVDIPGLPVQHRTKLLYDMPLTMIEVPTSV